MKRLFVVIAVLAMACCVFADAAADIEAGRRAAAKADLAFLWGSDTHHQGVDNSGASKEMLDDFVASANGMKVDFAALTGDIVNGYYNKANQQKDLDEICSWLSAANMPVMVAMGNHDDNSWFVSGYASVKKPGTMDELFPKEDFYGTVLKGHEKEFVRDGKNPCGGWYYKDFDRAKIRVIMLNCIDIPYIPKDGGGLKYIGMSTYGFSEAQLNWLAGKALRFDRPGWGVIVMTHIDFCVPKYFDGVMIPANGDIVEKLLSAFAKNEAGVCRSDKEDFAAVVKYNFRRNASNEVIASFAGHRHTDMLEYYGGVPHLLVTAIKDNKGYALVTVDREKRLIITMKYNKGIHLQDSDKVFAY